MVVLKDLRLTGPRALSVVLVYSSAQNLTGIVLSREPSLGHVLRRRVVFVRTDNVKCEWEDVREFTEILLILLLLLILPSISLPSNSAHRLYYLL